MNIIQILSREIQIVWLPCIYRILLRLLHIYTVKLFRITRENESVCVDPSCEYTRLGTNAVSAAKFLVTRRKIEIYIARSLHLVPPFVFAFALHRTNNYFSHHRKWRGVEAGGISSWFFSCENGNNTFLYSFLKRLCDNIFRFRLSPP